MTMTKSRKMLYRIITIGLMAALVYVGNYLQIKIPNGVLVTRIHLGNSMCLLAGLLFSSISGGLASGIGAGLYDLFDPVYIISAPYTFISKFAMGFTAGALRKKGKNEKVSVLFAAIAGQLVYIVLYLIKTYYTIIIIGGTHQAAWTAVGTNAITSSINAALAVIIAVPLYFTLKAALRNTGIGVLINEVPEPKSAEQKTAYPKWRKPVTAAVSVILAAVVLVFSMNLAASKKIKEAKEKNSIESACLM